jgi:protocatechuate 3,4-dioxygenase beta subunit
MTTARVTTAIAVLWTAWTLHPRAQQAAPGASAPGAIIAGRILTSADRPVWGARVAVVQRDNRKAVSVTTDSAGRFEVAGLSGGEYTVTASRPGFVPVSYGEVTPGAGQGGTAVTVARDARVEMTLRLSRGAVLTGRVIDEDGEPSARVQVRAMLVRSRGGSRTLRPAGNAATDDRGIYRIYGLTPGEYLLCADPPNDLVLPKAAGGQGTRKGPVLGYAPVYYPGASTTSGARTVRLGAEEERTGLDVPLQRVALGYVEGTVVGTPEGARTHVSLLDGGDLQSTIAPTVQAGPDGYFRIVNVPAGRYTLIARTTPIPDVSKLALAATLVDTDQQAQPRLWAAINLTINDEPVTDVTVALQPGLVVKGRLTIAAHAKVPPSDLSRARIRVVPVDAETGVQTVAEQTAAASVSRDGSFTIGGIPPGRYRLVGVLDGGWFVQSSIVNGQDTLDFPFELKPGDSGTTGVVTFSDERASVSGTVLDPAGSEVSAATVVMFADDQQLRQASPRRILLSRVSTGGHFAIADVPAGRYRIIAVASADAERLHELSVLQELEASAASVTVGEGQTVNLALKILRSSQ